MDDKGVLQVLHGALHPVVEWSGSFGKLKVQLVDGFKQLLGSLSSVKKQGYQRSSQAFLFYRPATSLWVKLKDSMLHFVQDLPGSGGVLQVDSGTCFFK